MTKSPTNRPVTPIACVAASCALLLIPQEASAAHSPANDADDGASRVADSILAAMVEANGVPGMAASVWRDGNLVWTGGAGYRDLENSLPVDDKTIFRIASVSKILAVTAAARLREQGRLDVDRPVQKSLNYLDSKWSAVTPRQLASHTAGIPHYQKVDEDRGGRRFRSVRESIGVFNGRDLLFAPGAGYSYAHRTDCDHSVCPVPSQWSCGDLPTLSNQSKALRWVVRRKAGYRNRPLRRRERDLFCNDLCY